jgi:hypothetical protein
MKWLALWLEGTRYERGPIFATAGPSAYGAPDRRVTCALACRACCTPWQEAAAGIGLGSRAAAQLARRRPASEAPAALSRRARSRAERYLGPIICGRLCATAAERLHGAGPHGKPLKFCTG